MGCFGLVMEIGMSEKTNVTVRQTASIGFGSVLFFIFLILKLTGHIAWSWWWVTAPLWIPFSLVVILLGLIIFLKA